MRMVGRPSAGQHRQRKAPRCPAAMGSTFGTNNCAWAGKATVSGSMRAGGGGGAQPKTTAPLPVHSARRKRLHLVLCLLWGRANSRGRQLPVFPSSLLSLAHKKESAESLDLRLHRKDFSQRWSSAFTAYGRSIVGSTSPAMMRSWHSGAFLTAHPVTLLAEI